MNIPSIGNPALWIGFTLFILAMLALDLGVFHRRAHTVRFREALLWSLVWMSLAFLFGIGVLACFGVTPALEFLTGYVIELSLSVDNLFVFLLIFSYFAVPSELQHRVLFWGILGAILMRAAFIALGATLIATFHWVLYIFGAFLVLTGFKLMRQRQIEVHPEKNRIVKLYQRFVPAVGSFRGTRFTVVENGRRVATLLLLVLLVVEMTDVVFAVDSVPAIFAVTSDPFIVFSSNIFAVLGLRSLYFLLAGMMERFRYLSLGLACVLMFVGTKMLIVEFYKIPITASLAIVIATLTIAVAASLLHKAQ